MGAQRIGTIAGTGAGAAFGNPWLGAFIGGQIGGYIDRKVLKVDREEHEGPDLDSVNVQTGAYGVGIPRPYGTFAFAGNLMWNKPVKELENDNGDRYLVATFAIGICAGPIVKVTRTWANDHLVSSLRVEDFQGGSVTDLILWMAGLAQEGLVKSVRYYLGTETQMPDPTMEAFETEAGRPSPGYRGLAYVVFEEFRLDVVGNAIPNFRFEVATSMEETVPYTPLPILPEITFVLPNPSTDHTLFMWTGFEMAHVDEFLEVVDNGGVDFSAGGRGSHSLWALEITGSASANWVSLTPNDQPDPDLTGQTNSANAYGDFWCYVASLPSAGSAPFCGLGRSGGLRLATFYITQAGKFEASGDDDNIEETSTVSVPVGSWFRCQIFRGNQAGGDDYIMKVDGTTVLNGDCATDSTVVANLTFGNIHGVASGLVVYFDDAVLTTGNWINDDVGITRVAPPAFDEGGVTTVGNWEANAGDLVEAINDYPHDGESTFAIAYDFFTTTKQAPSKLLYKGDEHTEDSAPIYGVLENLIANIDLAPPIITQNLLRMLFVSNGIDDESTSFGMPGSGFFDGKAFRSLTDHGRSDIDWTWASINALRWGVRNPNTGSPQVTALALQVLHGFEETIVQQLNPNDHLVYFQDRVRLLIMEDGIWDLYDSMGDAVLTHVEHLDPNDAQIPLIPVDGCDFDVDERDKIHTFKFTGSSITDEGQPVILDGYTLQEIDAAAWTLQGCQRVRVCRNVILRWIAVIREAGTKVTVWEKETFNWGSLDNFDIDPPTDFVFVAMDFNDDTGELWLLMNGTGAQAGNTQVCRVNNLNSGWIAYCTSSNTVDITAQVAGAGAEIRYDRDLGQLMVGQKTGSELVAFYTVDSDYYVLGLTHQGNATGDVMPPFAKSAWRNGSRDGVMIYAYEVDELKRLDLGSRAVDKTWTVDPLAGESTVPNWLGGNVYDKDGHSVITGCDLEEAAYCRVYLDRTAPGPVILGEIVSDVCSLVNLPAGEIDVSELTDLVWGYLLPNRMRARGAIERLMEAYFFDKVETDGKIKWPKRGGASVVTVPEEDLAAHVHGSGRPEELVTTRIQDVELPQTVEVGYVDQGRNYEMAVQREQRQFTQSQELLAIEVPVAMTEALAMQIAIKRMIYAWVQRTAHQTTLPRGYSWLDPSDVITVIEGASTHKVRIERIAHRGGVLALDVVNEATSTYDSDAAGVELPEDNIDPLSFPGPTTLVLMDIPLLTSSGNTPGLYIAALGALDSWTGCAMFISRDAGSSYQDWGGLTASGVIGSADDALPEVNDPFVWDRGSTVTIRLMGPAAPLVTRTEQQVLSGANLAYLGGEIIAFTTADLNSDGTYTLSGFLRARYGTDYATGSHAAGDRFALLADANIAFHGMLVEDEDEARFYKAISIGVFTDSGSIQEFTSQHRNMMPLSPQHVRGVRNGSDDLTITWIRRARFAANWNDSADVPLAETTESYEIDVMDGSTVKRTITAVVETASYTATQQTTDFGSAQASIVLKVYQLSSVVGRGEVADATV